MLLTDYARGVVVDTLLRTDPVYLGLLNNGVELSYPSYARARIYMTALADDETYNEQACELQGNGAPATSYPVTHVAFFDALTAGNKLLTIALEEGVTIAPREFLRFEAGDIRWQPEAVPN